MRLLPLHAARERQVASHGLPRRARQARPRQRAGLHPLPSQQGAVLRRLSRQADPRPLLGELARTRTGCRPRRTAPAASAATRRSSCATSATPWTTRPTGRRRTRRWRSRASGRAWCAIRTQMCIDCHAAEGVTTTMRPRTVILVLLGALCVLLAAAGPAAAVTFTIPTGKSDRCLACHAKPDLGTVDVNGVEKSLTIDHGHLALLDALAPGLHRLPRRLRGARAHGRGDPGVVQAGQAHRLQRLPRQRVQDVRQVLPREPRDERGLHEGAGLRRLPRLTRHHRPDVDGVQGVDPRGVRALPRREVGDVPRHLSRQVRRAGRHVPGGVHRLPRLPRDPAASRTRTAP